MKRSHSVVGWGLVVFSSFCAQVAIATPAPQIPKHVHTMHLDGFRGDLFMRLVDLGQLPNFGKLLTRGKISTTASTVDKSETMKVIEAY